jgi:hypothetical protein
MTMLRRWLAYVGASLDTGLGATVIEVGVLCGGIAILIAVTVMAARG